MATSGLSLIRKCSFLPFLCVMGGGGLAVQLTEQRIDHEHGTKVCSHWYTPLAVGNTELRSPLAPGTLASQNLQAAASAAAAPHASGPMAAAAERGTGHGLQPDLMHLMSNPAARPPAGEGMACFGSCCLLHKVVVFQDESHLISLL